MGSNMQDINPNDVYPQMNLPDPATPWARTLQDDVIALKKGYLAQQASIAGANRFTASSAANMSEQITGLSTTVTNLGTVQTRISQTTVLSSSTQAVPYSGGGTEYTVIKPSWANYALLVSGATLNSNSLSGAGGIRLVLMHKSTAITAYVDYPLSLDIGLDDPSLGGTMVVQSIPELVNMTGVSTLYTRPWSIPTGSTSGTANITFITSVLWLAV